MTALRKILIEEEPEVTATVAVARTPAAKLYVVPTAKAPAPAEDAEAERGRLKNILLFFAAPFLGLAYIIAVPFVGLGFIANPAQPASPNRSSAACVIRRFTSGSRGRPAVTCVAVTAPFSTVRILQVSFSGAVHPALYC